MQSPSQLSTYSYNVIYQSITNQIQASAKIEHAAQRTEYTNNIIKHVIAAMTHICTNMHSLQLACFSLTETLNNRNSNLMQPDLHAEVLLTTCLVAVSSLVHNY